MEIETDGNCCTLAVIHGFNYEPREKQVRYGANPKYEKVAPTFEDFVSDLKSNVENYDSCESYEIDKLALIMCTTSHTQPTTEEYLQRFGFERSQTSPSIKYQGKSIVTLWSLPAPQFCNLLKEHK